MPVARGRGGGSSGSPGCRRNAPGSSELASVLGRALTAIRHNLGDHRHDLVGIGAPSLERYAANPDIFPWLSDLPPIADPWNP